MTKDKAEKEKGAAKREASKSKGKSHISISYLPCEAGFYLN